MKPRALDLFCCAGGAAMGLHQAGYDVTGVDIRPQPRYPFCFIQADAMEIDWADYDLIWASPPCQRYSRLTPERTRNDHPDLLPEVLDRLRVQPTPYVAENVPGTEVLMRDPIFLCGTMFGLNIWRHRWFEIGNVDTFFLLPPCDHSYAPVLISGRGSRKIDGQRRGEDPKAARATAIGIDWMTYDELSQAIPPAYSRFLAERIMEATCPTPQPPS